MRLLCESFKLNHKTTTLDLHGRDSKEVNGVYHPVDPSFTKNGAVFVGEMLQMNSTLTTLNLYALFSFLFCHLFIFQATKLGMKEPSLFQKA